MKCETIGNGTTSRVVVNLGCGPLAGIAVEGVKPA
jgi:hypothetical protein